MDQYIKTIHGGSQPQPQPTVNRMPPPPMQQQIDPRMIAAVLAQMQMGQQQPMSQQDTIVIQNAPEPPPVVISGETDPFQQQAQNFSRSPLGQAMIHGKQACGYQNVEADELMNPIIAQTAEVLAQAMGYAAANDPNKPGAQFGTYRPYGG